MNWVSIWVHTDDEILGLWFLLQTVQARQRMVVFTGITEHVEHETNTSLSSNIEFLTYHIFKARLGLNTLSARLHED